MKSTTIISVGILGVLAIGFWLLHQGQLAGQVAKDDPSKEPKKIHTSGSATVRVKPNRARVFLAVETTASTVKEARNENKKHVEKVLSSIQGLKIPDLKMKSTNVEVDVIHAKDEKLLKLP